MYLLNMLHKRTPITDADCLRGLACRALVGLSRSFAARQIMSKLPLFTSGKLQLLMKEAILPDKRAEHVMFQKYSLELIKAVSGGWGGDHSLGGGAKGSGGPAADVSMQSIHRADVVAQTKIQYSRRQLLQLIQSHLHTEGYAEVAALLQQQAHLPPPHPTMGPPLLTPRTPTPTTTTAAASATPTTTAAAATAAAAATQKSFHRSSNINTPRHLFTTTTATPTTTATTTTATPTTPATPNSIQIKINRSRTNTTTTTTTTAATTTTATDAAATGTFGKSEGVSGRGGGGVGVAVEPCISLDLIVREYLTNQHAHCINPVVTCPTFDLFQPHRCPEPRSLRSRPITNFTLHTCRNHYPGGGGEWGGGSVRRKFVYSRYRHTHTYRNTDAQDAFLCCSYSTDDQMVMVGTYKGMVRLYRKGGSEEGSFKVHEGSVTNIATHNTNALVLTSSLTSQEAALWNITSVFDEKMTLPNCIHATFSNGFDKIIATSTQGVKLYDLCSHEVVSEFVPKPANHYRINKAVLDPTDTLLLTDGVLFDVRSGEQLHKFDKISPLLSGVFHANGLEVISSSEVWDLRTFHLLRSVPALSECDLLFNRSGDVVFGVPYLDLLGYMYGDTTATTTTKPWETTSFRTLDATDYSSIATVDVKLILCSMSINHTDTQLACVECECDANEDTLTAAPTTDITDSQIRVYEIGMARHDDDDDVLDDDDDDVGEEEDDSDSDDSDSDDSDDDDDDDDSDREQNDGDEADDDDDGDGGGGEEEVQIPFSHLSDPSSSTSVSSSFEDMMADVNDGDDDDSDGDSDSVSVYFTLGTDEDGTQEE